MNCLVLKHFFGITEQAAGGGQSQQIVQMRAEDENVLRYVSGYVSLRRFEKQSGAKGRQFVECLSKMAIMGEESSFYEYTKEWLKLTNRGGLFQVRRKLVCLLQHLGKSRGLKETIIKDVQTRWSPLQSTKMTMHKNCWAQLYNYE